MKIHESAENYLETILILHHRKGNVRSIDIAEELNYAKASVSIGMKKLKEKSLIQVDQNGLITLTSQGKEIAERIYERHTLLSDWFMTLGVNPKVAVEDACRIEHVISAESFAAIKTHVQKRNPKS